jgi:hypothetical protein
VRFALVLILLSALLAPARGLAQPWKVNDAPGVVEIGYLQEWFHRELEPDVYSDTQWSTSSISLAFNATSWLMLGFSGGLSEFESDDFPGSSFERYLVALSAGVELYHHGPWRLTASARYLDTFDLDVESNFQHKRMRTIDGSVNVVRGFSLVGQQWTAWAGPAVIDDLVETYPYDSLDPVASTSGPGFGGNAGARVVLGGWVSLYGFASYVEQLQGGLGLLLHVEKGGL